MTTSGVTGQFNLTADQAIDMALRQCRVSPSEKTPDIQLYAQNSLELILKSFPNDGYDRWLQYTTVIGLLPNVQTYYLPSGAVEVIKCCYRQSQWPLSGGTAFGSSGNVANAFDNSLTTACVQTAINGNLGYNFGSGTQQSVVYWGINPFGTFTYTLVLEYSNDGVVWFTADNQAEVATSYADNTWTFYEISVPTQAQYYRIRETGGSILSVRSVYLGFLPSDTTMGRFNRDSYATLPNKYAENNVPVQFKVNTTPTGIYLQVWNVPNNGFNQLYVTYYSQPQDVGAVTNTLDIPFRWQRAVISELAYELALYIPSVDKTILPMLQQRAESEMQKVNNADHDASATRFYCDMRAYFRM